MHDLKNFLLEDLFIPQKISVTPEPNDPKWTKEFLAAFARPNAEYYVDHDYPGWLVWDKEFPAHRAHPHETLQYDAVENGARNAIGKKLDRKWFNVFFGYLKQEPRDGGADRFRMASSMLLQFAFNLVREGLAAVTFDEIKKETTQVLGDGSDKHQHRATAEILGALVASYRDSSLQHRDAMWEYVFPIVKKIFEDGLTPENSSYWTSFLHLILVCYVWHFVFPIVCSADSYFSKEKTLADHGLSWNGSLPSDWIFPRTLRSKKAPRYNCCTSVSQMSGGTSRARGLF